MEEKTHVNVIVVVFVVVIIIIVRRHRLSISRELCAGNQITPFKVSQHNRKRISTLVIVTIGGGGDKSDHVGRGDVRVGD